MDADINSKTDLVPLGDKIFALRKEKRLTQEELAEKVGTTKARIWTIEKGGAPRLSASTLFRIARVFGVTADYLLDPELSLEDTRDTVMLDDYSRLPARMQSSVRMVVRALLHASGGTDE